MLDDCTGLTSVVFVQVLDEYFLIHLCLQAVDVGGCCGATDPGHSCGSSMPAGKVAYDASAVRPEEFYPDRKSPPRDALARPFRRQV